MYWMLCTFGIRPLTPQAFGSKEQKDKKFATSEMFANCCINALVPRGISAPAETLEDIKETSLQSLQQMRASTGMQPIASKLPAPVLFPPQRLDCVYRQVPVSLTNSSKRPQRTLYATWLANRSCLKGAQPLAILPSSTGTGGEDDDGVGSLLMTRSSRSTSKRMFTYTLGAFRGVLNSLYVRQ